MRSAGILLIFTALLLLVPGFLLNSPAFLQSAVNWGMDRFTDFRVQLRDPHIDIFRGTVTASELALYPRTGGPVLVSATELRVQTSLQDIYRQNFSNSDVSAKNVLAYVSEKESRDDPEPLEWLAYLSWLPRHLEIAQFHLIIESDETWVFQVKEVSGASNRDISYRILANADYSDQALEIQLDLLNLQEVEESIGLNLAGKLAAPTSGGWLELDGQLRGNDKVFTYELVVDGYAENISRLLNLAEARLKLEGAMEFSGKMKGDTHGFSVSDATLMLSNTPVYSFEAQGDYQQSFAGENQLNLFMLGKMDSLGRLVRWTGIDLSSLGSATANISLSGSLEQPFIDQFLINTTGESGLSVSLSGSMALGEDNPGGTAREERVRVNAHAPTLGVLSEWLGPLPYEPGPWRASAQLKRMGEGLRISDIFADAGTGEPLQLHIEGDIAEVIPQDDGEPLRVEGIDLQLSAFSNNPAALAKLADIEIPAFHSARGKWGLTGNAEQLAVRDGSFTVTHSDLNAKMTGLQAILSPGGESPVTGFTSRIDLELGDSSALSRYVSLAIPALGQVQASGVLQQERQELRLERLSGELSGKDGVEFSIQGEIDDLLGARRARLAAELRISDTELLEALTGFRLNPITASAVIKTLPGEIDVELAAMVGQTQLETSGNLLYDSDRIRGLRFSLHTAQMFLEDFDLQAEKRESGELYKPIDQLGDNVPRGVLERILEHSPQYPTDVDISIGGITGDNVDIDRLDIHVKGENQRYMLRKFTAHYDNTVAEVRGIIDLNPVPPVFSLGTEILAVDMNELITDLGIDSDIRGTLTLRSGITAKGDTSEALLGSMNGSLALALEHAVIEGAAYDVLATDFLGWLYSGAALESSTHIDCARGTFRLSNGRASSDKLFMETRRMIATGEGHLDLVENTMDITITPKSKTRIGQIPSSITLKGDIKDPKVSVSAFAASANLYSELLLIVPNFFMKIFGRERAPEEEACVAAIIN